MNGRCGTVLAIALATSLVCAACHSNTVGSRAPISQSAAPTVSTSPSPPVYETRTNLQRNGPIIEKPSPSPQQEELSRFLWYAPTCGLTSRAKLDNESKIDFLFNMSYWLSKNHMEQRDIPTPESFWPEALSETDLYILRAEQLTTVLKDYLGLSIDEDAMQQADLIDDDGQHVLSLAEGPDDWATDPYPEIEANGSVINGDKQNTGLDIKMPIYRLNGGMSADRLLDAWVAPNEESTFGYTLFMLETKPLLLHLSASSTLSAGDKRPAGAENLVDTHDGTSWGTPGDGINAELNFEFAQEIWIDALSIQPGDAESVKAFIAGRQIERIRLTFSDGSSFELDIPSMEPMIAASELAEDDPLPTGFMLQVPLPYPVKASQVDLTILKTSPHMEGEPDQTMIGAIDFFGDKRPISP